MASSGNCLMPEDMVIEILLRLPVKSLLRFKCVCKYWYILIKSSDFISKHLHHNSNHSHLLVHHYIPEIDKCHFTSFPFPDETLVGLTPAHQDLDYLEIPPFLDAMLGPVNGLFFLHTGCVSQNERMAMWNPATQEFRPLPLLQTYLPPHFTCNSHEFGFGLDPLTNAYKVVSIRFVSDEELDRDGEIDSPIGSVVELYTFGNDSWRLLDPDLDSIRHIKYSLCASATYLNGAYYWLSDCNKIVMFDMSSEMFKEIQGPDNIESIPFCGELVLHNDSIALFYYECSVDIVEYLDLWVMKQEGCWSKLFTIGPLLQVIGTLGIWKNDEIFLQTCSSQLVFYDPNTHEIRNVGIGTQGNEEGNCLWVSSYKESLVSLKGGRGDCDPNNLSDILEDFFKF